MAALSKRHVRPVIYVVIAAVILYKASNLLDLSSRLTTTVPLRGVISDVMSSVLPEDDDDEDNSTGSGMSLEEIKLLWQKYGSTNRDYLRLLADVCERKNVNWRKPGRTDCPCPPRNLFHRRDIKVILKDETMEAVAGAHPDIGTGGTYDPKCNPVQRVAIIVPVRDREFHLRTLLAYMHPFLQRQSLSYRIFVVEQTAGGTFNKARLMNAGFIEIFAKYGPFDCVIFNDVDMFPEDDRNLYTCARQIRHMGSHVSKFAYKLIYPSLFGGVIAMTPSQFRKINGFSNGFIGWGGEDDDMYRRVRSRGLHIVRHPKIAYYYMIKHDEDMGNPRGRNSYRAFVQRDEKFYDHEGLNTATYNLMSVTELPICTRFLISFNMQSLQRNISHRQKGPSTGQK